MATDSELESDLLDEARGDWLDLFGAIAVVKIVEGGEGRLPLLRRAGPLLVGLVREGRLVCGEPDAEGGFTPWSAGAHEAAAVVEDHVRRALDGDLVLVPGEPCSFALPEEVRTT
ncbi:hypothetical protein PHK61_13100 [Actinomycetospora lutea]|uniref:hypothetical protein n=1 Tax=Actinomycetospora lutea TaxID=663604 RepID=UPI002365CB08|nr:hypothetical protein [Actinomycetospora lutea]MDD7939355.1 hypothetical protein [Actinomycetospora lutea]